MRYVIYLASKDESAFNNFVRIKDYRSDIHRIDYSIIDYQNGALVHDKTNHFANLNAANRNDITVDFIAHGHPYENKLIILPLSTYRRIMELEENKRPQLISNENLVFLTPQHVIDFFVNTASEMVNGDAQMKFSKFNLFCCTSVRFGQDLSRAMRDVEVTCFEHPIYFEEGIVYRSSLPTQRIPSPPYVFKNGIQISGPEIPGQNNQANHPNQELLSIGDQSRPRSKSVDGSIAASPFLLPSRFQTSQTASNSRLDRMSVPEQPELESENKVAATVRRKSL
jgi:hypothetical protein